MVDMVDSTVAINYVMSHEGGLVDNPNDPGGITQWGISLRFLKSLSKENLKRYGINEEPNEQYVRYLSSKDAAMIYKGEFWDGSRFDQLQSQDIANYLLDCCVLHGLAPGIKIMQRALCAFRHDREIIDDGILGTKTLMAAKLAGIVLIYPMRSERAGYCRLLVEKNPNLKVFLNGWLNRCYGQ